VTTWRRRLAQVVSVLVVGVAAVSCQAAPPKVETGMTVHLRGADAASLSRQFDLMADMHVTWVRVDVDWSVVEPARGQFDWSYPDTLVDAATAHGMKVLIVVAFSPAWTRAVPADPEAKASHLRPDQVTDFADFARLAAERYASRGTGGWEIWNEPNSTKFWPPAPDADEYGRLFRAAATAIRSVDPKATLLIGGLAPWYAGPEAGVTPADFLDRLYANGTAQLADAVAVHPYSFPGLPMDASPKNIIGGFADLPALHGVMVKHDDGDTKIWITEFGAPTGTGPNSVSEDDQAKSLVQAHDQVLGWEWAGPLIYYELVDGGTDPGEIEENFGVLREDLSLKPAAVALIDDEKE